MQHEEQAQLVADLVSSIESAMYVLELDDPDDPGGMRLVLANPATAALWGIPVEQLVGRTIRAAVPGFRDAARLEIYAEVARGGPARDLGDVSYGPPTAGSPTFAVRAFPLPGNRVGVVCNEVTEQRAAEARAVQILDSMNDAFYSLDREWRFTSINAAAERVTKRTREQLLGRSIWDVYPAATGTVFHEAFHRAARERVPVASEQHFVHFDTWIAFQVYPTPEGLAVFAQDISDRKRLEERLRQSQKMEAVSALAGGIAHDFNNALTAIRAAADLALNDLDDGAAKRDVQQIELIAEHAASLTQQLLTISRARASKVEPTALGPVLEASAELVAPLVGDTVALTMQLDATDDTVLVDSGQLQQVILNLSLNAREAMPDGGTLQFRTSNATVGSDADARDLRGGPGRYVVLEVADSGRGMDEEAQRRAFDPFFTTKRDGIGLGLSSVYGIVAQAGGHIDVRSERGVGTTFTIYLNAVDRPATVLTEVPAPIRPAYAGSTILVVEDDDQVRPLVVRSLARLGYTVLQAASGAEAVRLADRAGTSVDLLLTDVVMPGMSGGELAVRLRVNSPDLRVLFMSGYPSDTLVQRGVQDETAAFLQKPFRGDALAAKVRATLDGGGAAQQRSTA